MKMFVCGLALALTVVFTGCGKKDEKKADPFQAQLTAVCDCYKDNASDWLEMKQKCVPMTNALSEKYAKDKDKLTAIGAKLKECQPEK